MTQLSGHVIWIIFGKLPVLLALSALVMVSARRLGGRVTLWSLVAFLTSLSIGVTLLPSILGAMAMSAFSALCVLSALTRDISRSWRLLIWPKFYYQSSPGNRLSLGLSLFDLSEVSGLLSPDLELGFEVDFWEILIGVQDSGFKNRQLYGAQIGWRL